MSRIRMSLEVLRPGPQGRGVGSTINDYQVVSKIRHYNIGTSLLRGIVGELERSALK